MFSEKVFHSEFHKNDYLKYYSYEEKSDYPLPLLIYIHGAGSRGTELSQMSRVGPLGEIDKGRKIPALVVAPQCHKDTWFDLFAVLEEFIEHFIKTENIDKSRVYICGISMGAYCAWQMAMSHPEWFAALVPVCGGGRRWKAGRLKNLPIWAFHGECDDVISPKESVKMVNAVNRCGGNAKITIYPNTKHNSWEQAFCDDNMWKWIFEQKRSDIQKNKNTKIKHRRLI